MPLSSQKPDHHCYWDYYYFISQCALGFLQVGLLDCLGGRSAWTVLSDLFCPFCLADRGILMAFR